MFGVDGNARELCRTFPGLRAHLRHQISNNIASEQITLTMVAGDFNSVVDPMDRYSIATAATSTRNDKGEGSHFKNTTGLAHGMVEMHQLEHTHAAASTRSRLDRIYCNQHVSEQLGKNLKAVALGWKPAVSSHRAVLFSHFSPHHVAKEDRQVAAHACQHAEFPRLVALNFNEIQPV